MLVALVLSFGGNQAADIWMGAAMAIGPPIAFMNPPRWQNRVKCPIEGNHNGRHLNTEPTNIQAVPARTEYLRLRESRKAEGRKKTGKSSTPHNTNCEMVLSFQPYTWGGM